MNPLSGCFLRPAPVSETQTPVAFSVTGVYYCRDSDFDDLPVYPYRRDNGIQQTHMSHREILAVGVHIHSIHNVESRSAGG